MISVIVPAYNAEGNLRRAIKSIISQEITDLEIIIIDDGSVDSTGEIAEEFARYDRRIQVYHIENGGEARARNLGVKLANGEYICFCDADDVMHKDMLNKMMFAIKSNDADIVICSWIYVDISGNKMPWPEPRLKNKVMKGIEAQKEFLMSYNIEGFCWNKLFKKQIFERGKIKYDEEKKSFCDMYANYLALGVARKVVSIEDNLYDYYQLQTSCTHNMTIEKEYNYLEAVDSIVANAVVNGMKKEGNRFQFNRINKQLYELLKGVNESNDVESKTYIRSTYERYICNKGPFKYLLIYKLPIKEFFKSIVKLMIVEWRCRKIKNDHVN